MLSGLGEGTDEGFGGEEVFGDLGEMVEGDDGVGRQVLAHHSNCQV